MLQVEKLRHGEMKGLTPGHREYSCWLYARSPEAHVWVLTTEISSLEEQIAISFSATLALHIIIQGTWL